LRTFKRNLRKKLEEIVKLSKEGLKKSERDIEAYERT